MLLYYRLVARVQQSVRYHIHYEINIGLSRGLRRQEGHLGWHANKVLPLHKLLLYSVLLYFSPCERIQKTYDQFIFEEYESDAYHCAVCCVIHFDCSGSACRICRFIHRRVHRTTRTKTSCIWHQGECVILVPRDRSMYDTDMTTSQK
jgi:hypothetical protein